MNSESNKMRFCPSCCLTTTASVLSNILGFNALTGCDTKLSLSGKGKNTCWKIFIKYFHLLTEVERGVNVDDDWAFVCLLYGIREKGVKRIDDTVNPLYNDTVCSKLSLTLK